MATKKEPSVPAKKPDPRKVKSDGRKLTVAQRAEAAALWRSGSVTMHDLALKFKKRPETFSRLFKRMGVTKGEVVEETTKKLAETIEARVLNDAEENMRRIAETRNEHYTMSRHLAKFAWNEILRARKAGIDVATLKDLMVTLKTAGDVIGNSRKELFEVLDVARYAQDEEMDDLPELTVRELTGSEIGQLQNQSLDELGDMGMEMMPEDNEEAL